MKDIADFRRKQHLHPDREFAESILMLLVESAVLAGYRQGDVFERPHGLRVVMRHPQRGVLTVMLGKLDEGDHRPNRGRWGIANRKRWRRRFCALQDKLFKGHVPGWLRPGCTSCGRVRP